jgi:indole-3-acetate monooxygenase
MLTGRDLLEGARALGPEILAERAEIDRERRLPLMLVERLRAASLFRLWLPRALGGPELHPVEFLAVIETLAEADGSVAWCATNAGVLSLVAGSMSEPAAREIYGSGAVVAGSANPLGKAVAVEGGFRVTGRWTYASGINHADWIAANSVLHDGDMPRRTDGGAPEMRFMFFPKSAVEVIDTWDVSGLRGTGSHDYRVAGLFVPDAHTAPAFVLGPTQPGILYRVPPLSLFTVALAAVTLGLARAAVNALIELAERKTPMGGSGLLRDKPSAQAAVARAEGLLRAARAGLIEAIHEQWDEVAAGGEPSMARRARARLACTFCAEACAQVVDLVHATAGASAIHESGRIARCFRDVHAATQHIGLSPNNYELAGRVLLGLDPGSVRF